jgi:hypothetical protein
MYTQGSQQDNARCNATQQRNATTQRNNATQRKSAQKMAKSSQIVAHIALMT